ncbi:MAG: DUF2339 domain-containing protein [Candidatus Eremiobacteraeota bacterium]|nr:DUF2339 domain-containing protein [Candidatus Eremiobacteraeota bacterium]
MSFSTQTASRAEMRFAGHYLNWAGIALLLVGMLSLLRTTGWTDSRPLQCLGAAVLGCFLSWAGDRAHRQGLTAYAHPMLAAGSTLLLLTLGAAPLAVAAKAIGTFVLVIWTGFAAIRYRSPWLGGYLLVTLYAGPMLMNFSLSLVPYLLAIHLATTVVAYRQRWDYFLLGSFVGTYGLFLRTPQPLGLLTLLYALFLLSGSGFALLRRDQDSEVNLYLTSANSLLFAFVSYRLLLFEPNARALLIYFGLAALHLLLAYWATRRERDTLRQSNLALGILFAEAAVSFLTYCSNDTGYFAVTTFAWLAQALLLLGWGKDPICLRGSYSAIALAAVQLIYVVPTMDQPFLLELPAALALFYYFTRQQRLNQQSLPGNLVMVLTFFCAGQSLVREDVVPWGLLAGSAFVPVLLVLHHHYPATLSTYATIARLQTGLVCLAGCLFPGPWLLPMGAFLALADRRASAFLWLRLALSLPGGWTLPLALALSRWLRLPRLEWAATLLAVSSPLSPLLLSLTLSTVTRPLLLMKLATFAGYGTVSSLLWCLLGSFYLRRGQQTGDLILGAAFYKVVLLDANFVFIQGHWDMVGIQPLQCLHLLMIAAVSACYLIPRSNVLNLLGMLIIVFETSRVVYDVYGQLDTFQVILSAFWACASLFFILPGAYRGNKLCRLFGLTLLVACVSKMYAVDIWVLDAYDKSTTTLAMGALLTLVSFIYQRNRARLETLEEIL